MTQAARWSSTRARTVANLTLSLGVISTHRDALPKHICSLALVGERKLFFTSVSTAVSVSMQRPRFECLLVELIGMSVEIFLRWDRESEALRSEDGLQVIDRETNHGRRL